MPTLGNTHITSAAASNVVYNTRPPTSGPHLDSLARWGIHLQPIADELQVHNLEDGGVLVQYNCRDCDDLIRKLETRCSSATTLIMNRLACGCQKLSKRPDMIG